jgi:hypothetical protein
MNKRLHGHKKADSSASFPVHSQFQSRPFIAQAKPQSEKPLTQTETENGEFQQQKFEATQLNLQAKNGTITPEGQEQLAVLQAKMSGTLQRRLEQASSNGSNLTNIPISRPDAPSQLAVQTKLTIGKPGDKYEKEADQIAEQLDKLTHAPVSPQADQNRNKERTEVEHEIQRKPMLQLRSAQSSQTATEGLENAINQARGGGQPLAEQVRTPMEQFLGADFSRVKVHTDKKADELSRALQARAFTTRQDIFFAKGEYKPESREGRKLIFHEGGHVAQQTGEKVVNRMETGAPETDQLTIDRIEGDVSTAITQFNDAHPGFSHLVEQITNDMDEDQIVTTLLRNFYNRTDFEYTGGSKKSWGKAGDCSTLVREFIDTARFFGIHMELAKRDGPLFIRGGGKIINNTDWTGNVDNGSHWFFENHVLAQWNGQEIDVLFGSRQAVDATSGFTQDREGTFTTGGTTYYLAQDMATNVNNRYTSNQGARYEFPTSGPPRPNQRSRFCCGCEVM